ncbi:UNVERIFIED_CONTAM: hypothetical protein GTU68_032726 [Idotea baltica]|nr:hypothetical protein [Idotea baltica]
MYNPRDKELVSARLNARLLLRKIAEIPEGKERQRKHFFRELLGKTGQKFYIENPFICDYGTNIYWGENSYANFGCIILDAAPVYIGENVMMGPSVKLFTATHPIKFKERNKGLEFAKSITIGDNVWIGGGAIINPGVTIGNNSVIGSGSIVTSSILENVVAAGNPCKVLKEIDN